MPLVSLTPPSDAPEDKELAAAGVPETSPTWELELLISGAVLFALFQLPGAINPFFARLEPHATLAAQPIIFMVQLYVRAIIYALIVSFVVHLTARTYWVGLVGLHSVFPKGVRWEETKAGPVAIEVMRSRVATLPSMIAKTDNFCSVIFSFAFLLVLFFVFSITISGVIGGASWLLAHFLSHGRGLRYYFYAIFAFIALNPLIAMRIDKRAGARIAPTSAGGRFLRGAQMMAYYSSLLFITGPIFLTLTTNVGRRKMLPIVLAAFMALFAFVAMQRLVEKDALSVNSEDYFASSAAHGVDYRHYENQRDADAIYPRTPSIQSDVIRDPYVKLFIPYVPARHNTLIATRCPAAKPLQSRGVQLGADTPVPDSLAEPVLRCLAAIHRVTLNGAALPDLDFAFYEHPGSGVKGILAYIPTSNLPRGKNVLTVEAAPGVGADAPAKPPLPWVIPFWL